MSQTISLWGATYSNVPGVDLPTSPSGTARFTDVTPTTATDSDVASGKIYFKSDGTQSTGTASGGGGGGSVTQDQDGYIVIPSTGGGGGGNATIETGTFTVLSDISVPNNTTASVTIGFSGQPDFIYCWMSKSTFDSLAAHSNNRWYKWWIAKKDSSFATIPPIRISNTNDLQPYVENSNYITATQTNVIASSDATNVSGYALQGVGYFNRNVNAYAINNDGTIALTSSSTATQLVLAGTYNYIAITGATMYPA